MNSIVDQLAESMLFKSVDRDLVREIADCATHVQFNGGDYIFHAGDSSSRFYVLRTGKVSVEVAVPGKGAMIIQTLGEGDVLGWSWIIPPHEKQFDARAMALTRALALDGDCVRRHCEEHPKLGYEILRCIAAVVGERLSATRLQLMDVYGA